MSAHAFVTQIAPSETSTCRPFSSGRPLGVCRPAQSSLQNCVPNSVPRIPTVAVGVARRYLFGLRFASRPVTVRRPPLIRLKITLSRSGAASSYL